METHTAKRKKPAIFANVTNCRYEVVHSCCKARGWKTCTDEDNKDWNIYWTDTSVATERVMKMHKYQKINHFPGMNQLTRKGSLARSIGRMRACFPAVYDFFPRTWTLPAELSEFRSIFN